MRKRLTLLVLALSCAASAAAEAPKRVPKDDASKRGPNAAPAAPPKLPLDRFQASLEKGTPSEMLAVLDELARLGPAAAPAAPLVDALLGRGANAEILRAAFQAAAAIGQPASSDAVAPYVRHRNREIRQSAATALIGTKGPKAVTALRSALGSPDAVVRAEAARGLGVLGAKESVDDLFTVLAQDNSSEAAVSIAQLCAPAECDRLMALVGKVKFETLEPAFVPLLLRPAAEIADERQLRYVERLRRLATPAATTVLKTALAQLKPDASAALRGAIQVALRGRPVTKEVP